MRHVPFPWPGLAALAPRVDLWPVLEALARARRNPAAGIPLSLGAADLIAAGLSMPHALGLAAPPWPLREGVHLLTPFDPAWPTPLIGLEGGPILLTAEGNLSLLSCTMVAIVGARACTPYGREWARRIALGVVGAGGVVVSGLAAGIDVSAHAAAGGRTIAVLGQGLDLGMAAWQQRARVELLQRGGLVLSELPGAMPAGRHTFPVRNRIIAGLAVAVAVVEAGERSGTRNTAAHALRYGREVLALPGPLGAPASVGCLALIQEGAEVIMGVHTVLRAARLDRPAPNATSRERIVGSLTRPHTAEELGALHRLPHAAVMAELGVLELTGQLIRLAGARYQMR